MQKDTNNCRNASTRKDKSKKVIDGKEVEEEQTYNYIAYKQVYVYDISQTVGEPIPLQIKMLDSENMGSFLIN